MYKRRDIAQTISAHFPIFIFFNRCRCCLLENRCACGKYPVYNLMASFFFFGIKFYEQQNYMVWQNQRRGKDEWGETAKSEE